MLSKVKQNLLEHPVQIPPCWCNQKVGTKKQPNQHSIKFPCRKTLLMQKNIVCELQRKCCGVLANKFFFDECAICIREAFKAWKRCEFEFWCTLTQSLKITQKCLIYYNLRATIMLRILITISQIGCKFQVGHFMVILIHCEFLEYWFWTVKLSSTRQPLEPFADAILVFFQCYQTKPDKCGLAALMWRLRECNCNCCVYTRIDFSYKR